ncbi:MAG: glycosyltransferase, partial [Allorhizobium sp.]
TLPAQKADIVRYEVVLRHGGVFIDLDFEPLKNLETILGGLQGFVSYESRFWICNGIFGSVADYPLMRALVYDLDSNWERYKDGTVNQQTGPHYITKLVKSMALPDFRAFTRHIFFPYEWNQDDPGVYDDYSYAVHHFDKVRAPAAVAAAAAAAAALVHHAAYRRWLARDVAAGELVECLNRPPPRRFARRPVQPQTYTRDAV